MYLSHGERDPVFESWTRTLRESEAVWASSRSVATAARHGIVVNTVQCGTLPDTTQIWQQIARAGAGRYVAIRQDGGMLAMTTPHDEELARLNRELSETVVAWGAPSQRAEIEEKRSRALAAPAPSAASRLAYLSKTGGKVNSGRADLVDAVKDGEVDPRSLEADALPEPLRAMAPEERQRGITISESIEVCRL